MANDVNQVTLIGRLTRDPELRQTKGGTSVCTVGLAVNAARKNAATGEWEDQVSFFDVTMFGGTADATAKHMSKGSQIGVNGKLEQQRWETDAGDKRSKVVVIAHQVQFLGSKSSGDPDTARAEHYESDHASGGIGDDDIPF